MAYSPSPKTATVVITASQLKSLSANPITVVPAPGSGKYIIPVSLTFSARKGTVQFTDPGNWAVAMFGVVAGNSPVPVNGLSFNPGGVKLQSVNTTALALGLTTAFSPLLTGLTAAQVISPTNLVNGLVNNGAAVLQIAASNGASIQATVLSGQPTAMSVAYGGRGYTVNDTLTVASYISGSIDLPQATVASVDGNGAVLTITLPTGVHKRYVAFPAKFLGTTGGTGSGCYLNVDTVVGGLSGVGQSSLSTGGTGYANGDTGVISNGVDNATYVVDTVSAGAVVTYHLTSAGTGYITGVTATTTGGAQPGVGTGFQVNITGLGGGYAVNDTGTVSNGGTLAQYIIDSVDSNGNVLTYHLTTAGTSYSLGNTNQTATAGAQPGKGKGFCVTLSQLANDLTVGDGGLVVNFTYEVGLI